MRTRLTIKDKGLARLLKVSESLARKPYVKVGVMGDSARAPREGNVDTIALAVIHEFGVPQRRIPARPFLRSTFDAKKSAWNSLLSRMALGVVRGKLTVEQALGLLGQRAAADVKLRITTGSNFVPNAPMTIARKGSSRPLVDTGRLVASISYVVVTP
jgi:hypothetical protein